MNCKHCGVFNVDGANYCRGCGKKMINNSNGANTNVLANGNKGDKNKNSPLTDMKNKLDKLSYGIIVLTVVLILACFLPFLSVNMETERLSPMRWFGEYGEADLYAVSLVQFFKMSDLLHEPFLEFLYTSSYRQAMEYCVIGVLLILAICFVTIISTVKKRQFFPAICIIPFLTLFIIKCCNSSENLPFFDYVLGVGAYFLLIIPVIMCCIGIKQNSLQKNIKELTLYYKANGIMEYTADDFVFCPSCNKKEFVKESGYCRNCDFKGDYKSVKYIQYIIQICALENLIAALLTTNSNWIEIFSIVHLRNETIQKIYSLDVAMCVIYWILFAFWLMPAIAASEQNEKTFLYFLPIYSVLTFAVIYHIFALTNILPYEYSEGCKLGGFIIVIGNVIEIISIIKQWKKSKLFFCKKYGPKVDAN